MATDAGGVLLVHAHPDDECMATGGLIARSVAEGRRVDLVTCTNGEEGEIHDPDLDPDDARPRLMEIRLAELAASLQALGGGAVRHHLLGHRDSGMMGTEPNTRPEAFWNVNLDEPIGRVVALIRAAQPEAVVTYDSNGNYGHPDHINAHRVAVGAWEAAADPARFPEAGTPYAVPRLYEIAFSRERWLAMMAEMRERGIELPWDFVANDADGSEADAAEAAVAGEGSEAATVEPARPTPGAGYAADELNPTNVGAAQRASEDPDGDWRESFGLPDAEITTRIDVLPFADAKRASMAAHRTQRQDMGWLLDLPEDLQQRSLSPEHFTLTRWRDHEIPADLRETSIFST